MAIYNSYVNLTPANPNFNIRNFYVNKLKQQGATAYREDGISFAVTPVKINYAGFISTIKPVNYNAAKMNWWFNYDEKNSGAEMIFNRESNVCDTCILNNKFSFFKIKQLLYYKNNRFNIQNILLSPVIYTKQAGDRKEKTTYFEAGSFAFNEIKNEDEPIPAAAKFVGRSCNNLVLLPSDSANKPGENMIALDNWNLAGILYKDIKSQKLKAYNADRSIYPDVKNVLDYRKIDAYKNRSDMVPYYDSNGVIINYKTVLAEINFDSIYNFTLIQDFYFDFTKEILYAKPVALVPRISVVTSTGINIGFTDYWGVIFPEAKKKAVKKNEIAPRTNK